MVLVQSIIQDLQNLPTPALLKAAQYVHRLRQSNPKKQKSRLGLLATAGCLPGKEGEDFERAVKAASHYAVDQDDSKYTW